MRFTAAQDDEGRWVSTCDDLPGVWGAGSTPEEAYAEARLIADDALATFGVPWSDDDRALLDGQS